MKKRLLLVLGLLLPALPAAAEELPRGPFRIVSGFAAGGSIDTLARFIARAAQDRTGRTFVVENRPGAGGTLGAASVARAAPSGETLLVSELGTVATARAIFPNLPYDPEADLAPVILAATQPIVIVSGTGATTLAGLLDRARQAPGRVTHGATGVGNVTQFLAAELARRGGVEFTDVHYRSGGEGTNALLRREVDFSFASLATATPHIQSGALRALAVLEAARLPEWPELPTAAETLPGLEASFWYGLHAPAATPPATIAALNAAIGDALRQEETRRALSAAGFRVAPGTSAEYGALVARERATWIPVIQRLGLAVP
ncbi:Bug family tripartite tricarboxylate transporter substrate binding protein [Falsiroseomonas ponticola]|uniref:Bug family tripartite tricarboxylate transporter substrate binding protein n=1 Tax=Falsiroseomonas ponticola TaxID=2786951 RepID=UPI001933D5ED|nr:tripartite tricarboxylate transporter substrate binding protein [Roseomonas ponticola]